MKQKYLLLILCSLAGSIYATKNKSNDIENTSKTYLASMPHFQLGSPEFRSAFRSDRIRMNEDGYAAGFQVALFGSKSVNEDDLARYFFPCGKKTVTVGADIGIDEFDILANHFNIFTGGTQSFLSTIAIKPKTSVIGVGLGFRHSFCRNEEKNRGFWFGASAPLMRVKNNMNLSERSERDVTIDETLDENVVANMREAFNQSEWNFGKISPKSLTKTGLANIDLQIGYEKLDWHPCHMESYIGIHIPTGNRPKGEYLFEPIVGNGKHFGINFGGSCSMHVWDSPCNDFHVRMEYAGHSKYLFKKEHVRSFDLKNKPWSRYIEVYKDVEQAQQAANTGNATLATPGINVFTKRVDVTPGFIKDINMACIIDWKECLQLEGGYHFHSRGSECVELAQKWQEVVAIKHALGAGATNPIRDITGNVFKEFAVLVADPDSGNNTLPVPVENFANVVITEDDLDLSSAATPCLLSHTLYATATYDFDYCQHPLFGNVGLSYTFSGTNNAVHDRWTLWVKGGISF